MTEGPTDTNRWPALIIICLGYLKIELDVTIVGVALRRSGRISDPRRAHSPGSRRILTHLRRVPAARGSMHPPRTLAGSSALIDVQTSRRVLY